MEFKDLFDKEKIQKNEPEEILDAAVQSIFNLGPIIVNSKEMNELAYKMPIKAEFDEVSNHISYEEKEGVYEITVPSFDERKLPEFQIQLFQKKVNDCFPERGFYITGNSELIVKPLGLIKVEMAGLPIIRVGKDIRYTQPSNDIRGRGYREYLYFYYDYETKEYHRVYSDKLEKCKREMETNPKVISDYHETVQEYIKREQLLDEIIKKIYSFSISYLPKLNTWFKSNYGYGGVTLGSVEKYLNDYKAFLEETMVQNLKVKLIYSNVTKREYLVLSKKKKELVELIDTSLNGIDRIKEINFLTDENYQGHPFNLPNSFSDEEIAIIDNINNNVLKTELQKFKEIRPTAFPETTLEENKILKGYIDYDLKTNEVFPNIMQLQRRSSLTEESENFLSESDYAHRIIERIKRIKKEQNQC